MKKLHLIDSTIIDQPASIEARAEAKSILQKGRSSLRVQVDATHSGFLTNMRVYPGMRVRDSYLGYLSKEKGGTSDYDKPVLMHHNDTGDAVGRIIGAQYIQYKTGDNFEKDFVSPDTEQSGGRGSGVVRVSALITDQAAIEKILDGRLLSVSSGHSTKDFRCSLCGNQLLDVMSRVLGIENPEACDHIPGKNYETEDGSQHLCFGVTGNLDYKEISFVNVPAQPQSKVVAFDWQEAKHMTDSTSPMRLVTITRGKKSAISSMVLEDSDVEFDLLTGKDKPKSNRTSIMVPASTVESLALWVKNGTSPQSATDSETVEPEEATSVTVDTTSNNSRPRSSSTSVKDKDSKSDEQSNGQSDKGAKDRSDGNQSNQLDKVKKPEGDKTMDKKEEVKDGELSLSALKAAVESLTKERDSLQAEINKLKESLSTSEKTVEGKDSELKRLSGDMAAMQVKNSQYLATAVAQTRLLLKKPDVKDLTSKDALDAYIANLAKRSVDSLRDSIADLALELNFTSAAPASTDKDANKVDPSKPKLEPAILDGKVTDKSNLSVTKEKALENLFS